jgi:type 1 glutamine amidotransferase
MNRRQLLQRAGVAALTLGASRFPFGWAAPADAAKKKILMYTRSQGFQHSVVTRGKNGELSMAEKIVADLGSKHGFDVVCEKDGRIFLSKDFPTFDGFFFETQGDLLSEKSQDGAPPMTLDGKRALLDAVAGGKAFVGCHCASDTFHTPNTQAYETAPRDKVDPYIAMVGGEFIVHGAQQEAPVQVVDAKWPGLEMVKDSKVVNEEWYSLKNFAPDLHVILLMDTSAMKGFMYERPPFPQTWARKHEKGRVFFTSFGHREDVWSSDLFQGLVLGGLSWALGNVDADVTANIDKATPKANDLPMKK